MTPADNDKVLEALRSAGKALQDVRRRGLLVDSRPAQKAQHTRAQKAVYEAIHLVEAELRERALKVAGAAGPLGDPEVLASPMEAERDALKAEPVAFEYLHGSEWRTEMVWNGTRAKQSRALYARPIATADDDVLDALELDPEKFRTEGGIINKGKLRAAIRHPADYLPPGHWLRATGTPAAPEATDLPTAQQWLERKKSAASRQWCLGWDACRFAIMNGRIPTPTQADAQASEGVKP